MKIFLKLLIAAFPIAILSCNPSNPEIEDTLPIQVAKKYGFDNLKNVNSIAYTWNAPGDSLSVRSRTWKWNIKENMVYFADNDTRFTYSRDSPADSLPEADRRFINDKYWLMYPFQLAWDTGYTYEVAENVRAPITGYLSTKLTILYNAEDGYTPGDAYDLFLDENLRIREWVFRRGNAPEGRAVTWEEDQEFNGLTMATERRNQEGNRTTWFTKIVVE